VTIDLVATDQVGLESKTSLLFYFKGEGEEETWDSGITVDEDGDDNRGNQ
jgi:hypothetical protein